MQSPLWRRAAAMGALSWNATTCLSSTATPKHLLHCHYRSSAVKWGGRGTATASLSMGRPPLLGWNMPDNWSRQVNLHPPLALPNINLAVEPIAAVIDGKAIAQEIKMEVAAEVSRMRDALGKVPGLAVVLVGARKDSETYVRSKKKACEEVGITSLGVDLPEDSTEEEVLRAVKSFNDDPFVNGVLVQLPLPQHINEEKILNAVSIEKDVDGFHPLNIGRLAMQGREPLFVPCTPKGCIELLLRSGVKMTGKKAVVIGRSNIVGTPVSMLLQRHNATVTMVHSYTKNPADITREADILISAAGVPHLVRGDWLKPGAVVIDVGINVVEDPNTKRGYQLVGDVCYEEASRVASAITPVPGGVGPMTIAMLLSNTLESAKRAYGVADVEFENAILREKLVNNMDNTSSPNDALHVEIVDLRSQQEKVRNNQASLKLETESWTKVFNGKANAPPLPLAAVEAIMQAKLIEECNRRDKELSLKDNIELSGLRGFCFHAQTRQETWVSGGVRGSGGVACLYRDSLQNRISMVRSDESARDMWIRISGATRFSRDFYIAICYFPLTASPYAIHKGPNGDPFFDLYDIIGQYSVAGEVIILVDFNACTRHFQGPLHDRSEDTLCSQRIDPVSIGLHRIS
ncbi:hypothetical protein KI387_036892 [Taxus chinensis]|uniref:Methenyltetrahydrofolate cyclohydrolase n=1 Tax=Taxus chinensis TaxID=29808 RepID=A0AA38FRM2_TAXCH|nr:hypothetical protein KI387_036892 [Taxus chinensis]